MRKRSSLVGFAVSAVAATSLTISAAPPVAGSADLSPSGWPSLLETSLPDGAVADRVQVFAVPPSSDTEQLEDTAALVSVPASLVVAGQQFSILVDPTAVPVDYRRTDGVVDFSVFITDGTGLSWTTFTSARAGAVPASPTAQSAAASDYEHIWVDGIETDDDLTGTTDNAGYPILRQEPAGDGAAATTADYDDETVDVNPSEFFQAEVPSAPASTGNDCLRETYKGDVDRSTTIGTSYPTGDSTSRMVHTNEVTSSSELGVAVGAKNDSGSMEWKQSGSRYTEGSWTGTWGFSGAKRSYRIYTNYHKYILGEGCHGAVHYRRPHIETGGAATNTNGLTRPGWNDFCSPQPRDYTFTRKDSQGKAYSYGAAVKFAELIGIDLSIKKNYNKGNILEYYFAPGAQHKLCGKDDYPSLASKMIDRFN